MKETKMIDESDITIQIDEYNEIVIFDRYDFDEVICKVNKIGLLCNLIRNKIDDCNLDNYSNIDTITVFEQNELARHGIKNNYISLGTCRFILKFLESITKNNLTIEELRSLPIKKLEIIWKVMKAGVRDGRSNNV